MKCNGTKKWIWRRNAWRIWCSSLVSLPSNPFPLFHYITNKQRIGKEGNENSHLCYMVCLLLFLIFLQLIIIIGILLTNAVGLFTSLPLHSLPYALGYPSLAANRRHNVEKEARFNLYWKKRTQSKKGTISCFNVVRSSFSFLLCSIPFHFSSFLFNGMEQRERKKKN